MATVRLETCDITDWTTFHSVCQKTFGFPGFYGDNMDAWIDCMSYLDSDDGMTKFVLADDELLHIEITQTEQFKMRVPKIFGALIDCSAFVNQRYIESGLIPKIALIFL